jgi:hypothetical protein
LAALRLLGLDKSEKVGMLMVSVDWRSIAVGIVFLIDLIVFADLVRAEWRDRPPLRRAARSRSQTKVSRTSTELSQPMRSKVSAIQRSAVS